jgi:hypothetical protein
LRSEVDELFETSVEGQSGWGLGVFEEFVEALQGEEEAFAFDVFDLIEDAEGLGVVAVGFVLVFVLFGDAGEADEAGDVGDFELAAGAGVGGEAFGFGLEVLGARGLGEEGQG